MYSLILKPATLYQNGTTRVVCRRDDVHADAVCLVVQDKWGQLVKGKLCCSLKVAPGALMR